MKDSESLSEDEIDQIADAVIRKLGEESGDKARDDEEGWYPGKIMSKVVERVSEGATRGRATAIQDDLRRVGERFFNRNAIYKTKVQKSGRVAIPEAEMETLDLQGGEVVQVILFPLRENEE